MTENLHVILNPKSAGGRTAKRWPDFHRDIKARFGDFALSETTGPFSGEPLTRQALEDGATHIMAVGGDGTFSEATNGFFRGGNLISETAELSCLTSGSGCDLRKTLQWPQITDHTAMLDLIKSGKRRKLDLGHMTLTKPDGERSTRYFLNVTSFGLGGAVCTAVNNARISKLFGGQFVFSWHALTQGLLYRNQTVRIKIDDDFDRTFNLTLAAVANCRYFGGGYMVAPEADPEGGLFDVIIGHDVTKVELPGLMSAVRSGTHLTHPKVIQRRAKRVEAIPLDEKPVRHDVDGEAAGALPSIYTILPSALNLRG